MPRPVRTEIAWTTVKTWLASPPVRVPVPSERHSAILERTLRDVPQGADLIPDAHLAALAIEHCSTVRDFARFEDLRWRDPLR